MKVSDQMSRGHCFLAGGLLFVVTATLIALLSAMNSPVEIVRISGDLSVPERAEVKAAVLQRLNGGLLRVNLDDVVDNVLALSWPRDVQARRVWPGIVDVSVTKDPIAARWGAGGVLNSSGEVIDAPGPPDPALPLIRCVNANGARAMQIFQMLGQVLSDTPLKIAAVEENALGEWQVKFTNDLTVSLGHEELLQRVERFYRVYRGVIEHRQDEVDHIDARYGNGVAVSWREGARGMQLASASNTIGVTH